MNKKAILEEDNDKFIDRSKDESDAFDRFPLSATQGHNNYSDFFGELPIGVFVIQKGNFIYVNSSLAHSFGYENPPALIGKSFLDLIHPEDLKRVQLNGQGEHSRIHPDKIFRVYTRDGRIAWVYAGSKTSCCGGEDVHVGYVVDLTLFHERNATLEESLNKYKTIVDDVEDVLAEVDLKGNILTVNHVANHKIWVSQEQAVGTNYKSYVDKDNEKIVRQAYQQIFQTGNPGKVVYEITRIDGERRTVEDSTSLMRDSSGRPVGFRVVSRDVTDRKKTEQALAEHRTRLEAIFSSVKDAIITVDPQLRVIEANKSTENICRIAIQKITGQIFTQCLSQCSQACCEVLRQTLEKKSIIKEFLIDCSFQGQQMVSVSTSPLLDPAGTFMGAVMVIRDVTLLRNLERELRDRNQFQKIIGRNKRMQEMYNLLEDLADLETTVLVTGESGTGKELVAKALHYSGRRAFNPFVAVNCSALTENLLESELFGHVKGAFTGAIRDRDGRFQTANGGTILLDEIGDLSPLIQLKLLRVLEEKVFERVGDSTPRKVDVRVIACTNKNLKEKVRRGEFREDLYYRLKVVEVPLPPLRDRLEDIPLLVDHFQKTFNEKFNKHIENINQEVLNSFMDYSWPGNVRELEHVMEHAFILCRGKVITLEDLPAEFRESGRAEKIDLSRAMGKTSSDSEKIREALIKAQGNKAKAARILGISRQAIYRKIYQYQLI
jgi:PAS domain S-box-containing protein